MKKDIEIPIAKNTQVVATKEWDKEFLHKHWYIYIINNRKDRIESVLVMSRGESKDKKTTTIRRNLGDLPPNSSKKIEFIQDDVLGFTNEYVVTFFAENKLFERIFVFAPNSITDDNAVFMDLLGQDVVEAK